MSLVMKRPASSAPETNPAVVRGVSRQMSRDADAQRKRARTLAKQQQAAERVASASSQVSAGVNEAASAAEELKRASDEIASGAEEASGAAQESLAAITQITGAIDRQLNAAKDAQTRAQAMQRMVGKVNEEVQATVTNVGVAAQRQGESVKMVAELERQAANIGDIVKAVARIADQTNLLALNAAIEAARAGQHGKGFAVVADEVRTLAETSEKSAKQIQDLVGQIQGDVKNIAEGINEAAETVQSEAEKSKTIIQQLDKIGEDSVDIVAGANEIASAAQQSITAANQALKGAETIAAAATEQSSACEEAAKTVQEQSTALGLRHLFGLPDVDHDERHRIVVVSLPDGGQMGLVTDTVKEVLSVPRTQADEMPSLLSHDPGMKEFSAICRLDGGKRLVSIIATQHLPGLSHLSELVSQEQQALDPTQETQTMSVTEAGNDDDTQVVIFRLGTEEYGVPIMSVQEIVRVPDVLTVRMYHRKMLGDAGWHVEEAINGLEALEKVATQPADAPFDLYVSDINMPKMDGYAFVRELRRLGVPQVPVLMVSTEAQAQDANAAKDAGANCYLVKPARPAELVLTAAILLGDAPAAMKAASQISTSTQGAKA